MQRLQAFKYELMPSGEQQRQSHDRDLNAARNLATYAASSAVSACGEEGSGCGRTTAAKPASVKQEVSSRLSQK
jgi:hypothetical protein